ncbi:neuropeptide FF receptor 2-like [Oculina patagonica]
MNQTLETWNITSKTNPTPTYRSGFVYYWYIAYYVLLSCGAVLNSMVVFVMLRSGKIWQNISSFLIFHLSVTHLLFHVTVPVFWSLHFSKGNSSSCKALVLVDLACAAAIFNSLVAITWDRHRNVLRPFKSLGPRHLKTFLMLVAAIWTYAFVTSAPFIYSVRKDSRVICSKKNNGTTTCKNYSFCHLPSDWKTQLSKTIYFLLAFVIPLMYMFIAYTKIAVSLWERSKNGTIHGAVAKSKVKSTRLMVIAVLGFVLCWGPKFFVDLLNAYGVYSENNFELQIWCFLAQTSSSSINPAIYAFFSPEFRKLFFKFCCCCGSWRVFSRCRRHFDANRVQPINHVNLATGAWQATTEQK